MQWKEYTTKILNELDAATLIRTELTNVQERGTEARAECPFKHLHKDGVDNTPSFTVDLATGLYYCQTCHSKGNAHTFYKKINNLSNEKAWFMLGDALKIERPNNTIKPSIDTNLPAVYHQALMKSSAPIRQVLSDRRGLTDETLKRFQLGWDGKHVTIPIYDEFNTLQNIRLYSWNSTDDQFKMINYTEDGHTFGEVRIFGIENLVAPSVTEIVWCEGELDRICAEQHGFKAACPTSGAGAWRNEWSVLFKGKSKVYLAQDNDEAGFNATDKLCEKLYRTVDVYTVTWPAEFPTKGDITDFFVTEKLSEAGFRSMLDNAKKYKDYSTSTDDLEALEVHLAESSNSNLLGKRIKVPVMVSGKDQTPYLCPKIIHYYCSCSTISDDKICSFCGLKEYHGDFVRTLTSRDKEIMKLIKCTDYTQTLVLKELLKVNKKCPLAKVDIVEHMNIEDLRLVPKASANFSFAKNYDFVARASYYIGIDVSSNKRYTFLGYTYPDPSTQFATTLFDTAFPDKDVISEFEMTEEVYEQLKIFQVTDNQSIDSKFNEVHEDLERNITNVWERRDVAFAIDLVYHTVLTFSFQGQKIKRGWGELLIIGDSGQAKSAIVEKLMSHYRLGELIAGESSKRTGLQYSLQQNGNRWVVVWGAFPLNDCGLVAIDELSGISEDNLAEMSSIRSSGEAKVAATVTAETTARTRAIYISNPRNGFPLNTEAYGVSAILKLFGKAEDVRRLDLAIAVASGDVDTKLLNRRIDDMPTIEHRYTSDLCNLRTLWAWSRKADEVIFESEAVDAILDAATVMGDTYSSKVPLVEGADQRLKLARLSISVACCVFSTDSEGKNVIVKKEHVEYLVTFLNKIYSTKSMGYDKLSRGDSLKNDLSTENIKKVRNNFLALSVNDFNELAQALDKVTYYNRDVLSDYTGLPREELECLMKFLTGNNLVDPTLKGKYRRLPLFNAFLEDVLSNPVNKAEIAIARKALYTNEF